MKDFSGKLAIITGAGTGMGRELARQLAAEGCHLALCDVLMDNLEQTRVLCLADATSGARVTIHPCDVSDEEQMKSFRDAVKKEHATEVAHLLFNNAGIGGTASFINDSRETWEKTFNVCWYGVYYGCRAFVPMLVEADEGYIVNTSSVNGFWASLGPHTSHTAYSASKFAVKGFTEALINDLRLNAPHVKCAVVMPGHIGTSIVKNSSQILTGRQPGDMNEEDLVGVRKRLERMNIPQENMSDDQVREAVKMQADFFESAAPMKPAEAAKIILDGVREERWRILVGKDAEALDRKVREQPLEAYEPSFAEDIFGNQRD